MGEASNFCNRWACQHACKEGRERTVRVTEESNTKTDLSSRLASRIIMPRMACISAQEEAAQGACAEVVCMREAHIALVITTASFPGVKRSITQKNYLCKRKKLPLRGKSDKRINFSGRSPGSVGEIDEKIWAAAQQKQGRKFCHRGRAEGRALPVIHRTPCNKPCHSETSPQTGRGNP